MLERVKILFQRDYIVGIMVMILPCSGHAFHSSCGLPGTEDVHLNVIYDNDNGVRGIVQVTAVSFYSVNWKSRKRDRRDSE